MTPNSLCIVVPVFNEERRLPGLLAALEADADAVAGNAGLRLEHVIVVDDGSTDRTPQLLEHFDGLDGRLTVLRLERNRGKGAAVRRGMLAADAELALMTDVDLSTPLDELSRLAASVAAGADVAIGSRALPESQVIVHQPAYRELMGKAFNVLVRRLTGLSWRDTQCGFKLFRLESTRALFEAQRIERFAFDVELLLLAQRSGRRVDEVPVRWLNDPDTHVGLLSGSLRMALDLCRIAFRVRRRTG